MNVVDVVAILPFFVARFGCRAYLRWILSSGCCVECSIKMAIQTVFYLISELLVPLASVKL